MTPKRTPGPAQRQWRLTDLGRLGRDGNDGRLWMNDGEFGMFADAAPDLLAALELCDETIMDAAAHSFDAEHKARVCRAANAARAAIAKATGNEAGR